MTDANIFVFALVLLAAGNGALAWIIFATRKAVRTHAGTVDRLRLLCGVFKQRLETVEKQSPTSLAAEVVALSEAVQRLRATHQRFAGRFDQYMGQERDQPSDDGMDNPDFAALIRAQQVLGNGGV